MTSRGKRNIGALVRRFSRRRRVATAGVGVLVMSAIALGAVLAGSGGDRLPDGTGVANSRLLQGHPPATPRSLGITGALPRDSKPSPALQHNARNVAKFAASAGPGGLRSRSGRSALKTLDPGAMASLPAGPLGIPGIMLAAYQRAQKILASQQPGCHLPWWLLAGIGQIESGQADGGLVDAQGNTLVPILGPVLDGTSGNAAIPGSGGGWERAEGPMQFIPSTWSIWGHGGNPNNVYDAALTAGRYLCAGGGNLSTSAGQVAAVFSYNHSDSYVQQVLARAYAYSGGVHPLPSRTLPPGGRKTAARHSPGHPSSHPARGSSPSKKPTATSPSHPRPSSPASPTSFFITGQVSCGSGNSVEGVWVQAGRGSGFAPWRGLGDGSTSDWWFTLPASEPYALHVGCGGTTAAWKVATYSPTVSGGHNSFNCFDVPGASGYGTCRLR